VCGECGDVGRSDDTADGKRGAELMAAVLQLIAEERCRQGCVDEAGGDEVDSDGCELKRQVGGEGSECGGHCGRDPEADAGAAAQVKAWVDSDGYRLWLIAQRENLEATLNEELGIKPRPKP
jgi:hypothetical protein